MDLTFTIPASLLFAVGVGTLYSLLPGWTNYYSGKILRYPVILLFYSVVAMELLLYGFIRLLIRIVESIVAHPKHRTLRRLMRQSSTYDEWHKLAKELDQSQKREKWANTTSDYTAKHFSWKFLSQLMTDMRLAREENNAMMAVAVLQQCVRKNIGGIFSEELYSYLNTGEPKAIVTEFVQEIVTTLRWVTKQSKEKNVNDSVCQLLDRALPTYGRTALCLSGGGMMGCYHLGIIKALHDEDILPHIISGASAGSLVAAFTCTRTDEELKRDLRPDVLDPKFVCCARTWPQRIRSYIQTGCMFDNEEWLELVKWFTCGDMTFQEAYVKTGRTLCITLSTTSKKAPPILLSHISAPNVVIASAVVASACIPGLLKPMYLRSKTTSGEIEMLKEEYWDGSIEQDIPVSGLGEMLNCQFYIVAQCNPHIVPFVFNGDGEVGRPNRWTHSRRGGYLLSGIELYLKMDMRNKLGFLKEVGAVEGFTSNLMTQNFSGTATIVPTVTLVDFLKAIEDPNLDDMNRYFQGGSVAAYGSVAMIRLHYDIARAINECRNVLHMKISSYDQAIANLMSSPVPEKEEWEPQHVKVRRYTIPGSIIQGVITDL